MSGHSKWANIKHKKEKTDAQRGKIFTKIGREIAVAVKEGGGSDPEVNSRLKDVIAKAKSNNMPNDNIIRSIKKAAGEDSSVNYENIVYEGYASHGVAIIVEGLTDNRNRTASEMRYCFAHNGGSLGASGCVSWMFDRQGVLVIENNGEVDEDTLMMEAIEAGAEDVTDDVEDYVIYTDPSDFSAVRDALENSGYAFESAGIEMVPKNTVRITEDQAEKVSNLIDMLEDNDDVQNVFHNMEIAE